MNTNRRPDGRRPRTLGPLLAAALAIVALVLLAGGLDGLEFAPGRLPAGRLGSGDGQPFGTGAGSEVMVFVIMALIFLSSLLLPFAIVYFFISSEARRNVLRGLLLLLWVLALYLVLRANPSLLRQLPSDPAVPAQGPGMEGFSLDPLGMAPSWLVPVAAAILGLLVAALLVGGAWYLWRRTRRPSDPLDQLAREARETLVALQAGADVQDAVLRCYFQMTRVLRRERAITRADSMTPREFEAYLRDVGLPPDPVRELTHLFEAARYGRRLTAEREARRATACLEAIVAACRRAP
jgi:hypothetical protein